MGLASWLWALPCASLCARPVSRGTAFPSPLGSTGSLGRGWRPQPSSHTHGHRPCGCRGAPPPGPPHNLRPGRVRAGRCACVSVVLPHSPACIRPTETTASSRLWRQSGGGPRGQGPGSGLPGGEEPQGRAEYDLEASLGLLEHSPCSEDPPGSVRMGPPYVGALLSGDSPFLKFSFE